MSAATPAPTPPHDVAPPSAPDAAPSPSSPAPDAAPSPRAQARAPRVLLGAGGLRPVSERLTRARYLSGAPWNAILLLLGIGCIVLGAVNGWWWMHLIALAPLALVAQWLLLTPRRVRALGYLDREEDLVTASGIMLRRITVTPYGRVQSVELGEGPIERRLGLASLSVSTASATADATIAGLPRDEAERLRALLSARGIERMQSL